MPVCLKFLCSHLNGPVEGVLPTYLMRWSVFSIYSNLFYKQRIQFRLDWSGIVPSERMHVKGFLSSKVLSWVHLFLKNTVPSDWGEKRRSWIVPWKRLKMVGGERNVYQGITVGTISHMAIYMTVCISGICSPWSGTFEWSKKGN